MESRNTMRERPRDTHSDEIRQTAVYFFFLNFVVIVFAYSLYDEGMSWGLATIAVSMATSAMYALSATSSAFGAVRWSKAGNNKEGA